MCACVLLYLSSYYRVILNESDKQFISCLTISFILIQCKSFKFCVVQLYLESIALYVLNKKNDFCQLPRYTFVKYFLKALYQCSVSTIIFTSNLLKYEILTFKFQQNNILYSSSISLSRRRPCAPFQLLLLKLVYLSNLLYRK